MPIRNSECCGVHPALCVCIQCEPLVGAPEIWVVQHPAERGHTKGTLRIAQACLPNLRVVVGEGGGDLDALRAWANTDKSALLFPGAVSQPLEHSRSEAPRNWILLDATWRKARKMLLSTPWLAELPRFEFMYPPVSAYRIRKGPSASSLSTSEAIDHLITLTAPACDTAPLKRGLDALVQAQLSQIPEALHSRYE